MNAAETSTLGIISLREIKIIPYRSAWQAEFVEIGSKLRECSGAEVLRIDHIGSTSVPGLAAKDVIDIQVTVSDLTNPTHVEAFQQAGFEPRLLEASDLLTGLAAQSPELKKQFFREPPGERRTHIHVRESGRENQRYALLFRDYLRNNAAACLAYADIKYKLAQLYPNDIEGYLALKDPVMDLIYQAAIHWMANTNWQPDHEFI